MHLVTPRLLLLSLLFQGTETAWSSFSYHVLEAPKELRLCLQDLIQSQAFTTGTPLSVPPSMVQT